jgi:phosphoglycerate kinase
MIDWTLENQKVILRVDFNVPIKDGRITDDTRIVKSLATIQYLVNKKAKVIIMSHLGRPLKELLPDGSINRDKFSLAPVAHQLSVLLQCNVKFATDCGGPDSFSKMDTLKAGEILLLENTRFYKQEEKGDVEWAKLLSSMGNYYINDAFGAAHREHCSTATIARFFDSDHKAFGFLMKAEVENGQKILDHPARPLTAIIGGAKVSDKIELISNLIDLCDSILIGGGMAYTFQKAMGISIGNSLCEEDKLNLAHELLEKANRKNMRFMLPSDAVIATEFKNDAPYEITSDAEIKPGYMGLDIGPKTILAYSKLIQQSKSIIWNGPMGVFEMERFSMGTKSIAMEIADATSKGAYSIIGGGDSVAAISKYHLQDKVSFVSTGGGAMLEMLEGKSLPGVTAIIS